MESTGPRGSEARDALTSVVIVAADSGRVLSDCVGSVLGSSATIEVLLIDNASSDGEVERVEAAHRGEARLRILRNATNIGFGPACNVGAASAKGDLLVFLNPDCRIGPDELTRLRESFRDRPSARRIGLLGVTVCDVHGNPARGNRRRDPRLGRALSTVTGLSRLEARWPSFAGIEMPASASAVDVEIVEAVSGACMATPSDVFRQLRGFDEGYFLHAEDLDLCRRVRDAGYDVAISHSIRVSHVQGTSGAHRPHFVARHKHRGMWRYFTKFDPAANFMILRILVAGGIAAHYGWTALRISAKIRAR